MAGDTTTSRKGRRRSRPSVWLWELRFKVGPNLWVVPFLMAGTTIVIFTITRRLDRIWVPQDDGIQSLLPEWLLVHTAVDADVVLSAFLSALATVLALVFSISVLTFSMAAAQLGPRLIRRFMLDRVTQITLGAFLSSIVMCALTLGSVSTKPGHLPTVSYSVSVVMSLSCFFLLIVYVHRVATSIQSPRVIAGVVADLNRSLDEAAAYLPDVMRSTDPDTLRVAIERGRSSGAPLDAEATGYLQALDHLYLLGAAESHGAVVVMEHRVGQFVVEGQPLARVYPPDQAASMRNKLHEAAVIGETRTREQDIEFALNQVVEIALRALSPAVNDTFTGRTCVDWLSATLGRMGSTPDPTGGLCDREGTLRVVEPPLRFERQLRNAFDSIRQAGANNPAITLRMLDALAELGRTVLPSNLPAVRRYADTVRESAMIAALTAVDAADVESRFGAVVAAVDLRSTDV